MIETYTLPGWPAVYDPTVLDLLLLTVALPFGIAAVFAALIFGTAWGRNRTED